jgi:hypothetical protein
VGKRLWAWLGLVRWEAAAVVLVVAADIAFPRAFERLVRGVGRLDGATRVTAIGGLVVGTGYVIVKYGLALLTEHSRALARWRKLKELRALAKLGIVLALPFPFVWSLAMFVTAPTAWAAVIGGVLVATAVIAGCSALSLFLAHAEVVHYLRMRKVDEPGSTG